MVQRKVEIERLTRAARAGGGVVDPPAARAFDPGNESIRREVGFYARFVEWALAVFLLDLPVRRVRLFDTGERREEAEAERRTGSLPVGEPPTGGVDGHVRLEAAEPGAVSARVAA